MDKLWDFLCLVSQLSFFAFRFVHLSTLDFIADGGED